MSALYMKCSECESYGQCEVLTMRGGGAFFPADWVRIMRDPSPGPTVPSIGEIEEQFCSIKCASVWLARAAVVERSDA